MPARLTVPLTGARISAAGSATMSAAVVGAVPRSLVSITVGWTAESSGDMARAPSWFDSWNPMRSTRADGWCRTTSPATAKGTQACSPTTRAGGAGTGAGAGAAIVVDEAATSTRTAGRVEVVGATAALTAAGCSSLAPVKRSATATVVPLTNKVMTAAPSATEVRRAPLTLFEGTAGPGSAAFAQKGGAHLLGGWVLDDVDRPGQGEGQIQPASRSGHSRSQAVAALTLHRHEHPTEPTHRDGG